MSISIHNNTSSLSAQRLLGRTSKSLQGNLTKLTSGLRINSAADDAAGLAVSSEMKVDMRSLNQAKRNANDAISVLQTAESAMGQQGDILTRMRELSVQANNATLADTQRDALNEEFTQLQTEFDRIASNTTFNGTSLLDGTIASGSGLDIQIGVESSDTVTVEVEDTTAATLGVDAGSIDLSSTGDPAAAMTAIDDALETVNSERAKVGAMQNRMDVAIENLSSTYENTAAAHGRIVDVDVASEMASFTKNQVLMQAGSSMLAQANSQPQMALGLLG
ncbi:MAG: flagellin [Myxococcota bacterium]|jgi:flagellin|nr:flagellin [Myxococcota bacterium]